ncbi:MAG: hypothetical protein IPJ48_06975 [Propionivibrio sp.]|uniref:Uncharacterized protein n=1 Tax=Candidatus Propionivibrio dominans TaxID=2954373 RepID=A0A9D7I730_9RHOO|nr:hypothetical protein [Candidatus Propionivibrio dominans]
MNDNDNEMTQDKVEAETAVTPSEPTVASARRRLLKRGISVAPVVLTLASRPVLAWHCKSPSAWGSEQIDQTTSLKTNAGHASWADETWTITNWKNNTARSYLGTPWDKLYSTPPVGFDFKNVKISDLKTKVSGFVKPAGVQKTSTVVWVLSNGTEFQKVMIVAQLNYFLLAPLAPPNDMDMCITLTELQKMVSGTYTPPNLGKTWLSPDIIKYLKENYIVRPN